jgi:DNA-binding LytR/AlgR family response regulator
MLEEKDNTIRLMNYDNVVSDAPAYPVADRRITLFDNSGVLKFSIHSDNLYFIESDDNYIQVWYTDSTGTMKKYMLRCRLKTVEDSFADSDLVRCHRKFIVNIRKVRLLSSSRDGYILDLESDATPQIPVSKTYEQAVLARFNSRI